MKLALLGIDDESLALAKWAVQHGGHELTAAYDVDQRAPEAFAIAPQVRLRADWEELLLGSVAEVVIVGRGGGEAAESTGISAADRRADQLRKLAQAAVPMIVVCPACEAIIGFEIEMIRRDAGGIIVPYVPGAEHPAVVELEEMVSGGESAAIGTVQQISFERELHDSGREAVLAQIARDAALLRRLIGDIRAVAASGPARAIGRDPLGPRVREMPALTNVSVHFTGDESQTARWSLAPAFGNSSGRLTMTGTRGKAVLNMPEREPWSLETIAAARSTKSFAVGQEAAPEAVLNMAGQRPAPRADADSAWLAACRDQEAAEAVDRSLARGRTIELFNEQHTEESSFKGVMAMGGCLILMTALAAVLVATIIDALRLPIRDVPIWRLWPFFLLAPLGIFLILQFLQLAIKRPAQQ